MIFLLVFPFFTFGQISKVFPDLPSTEPRVVHNYEGFSVDFDWKMADRFGIDANRNGLIDLPNTFQYASPDKFVVQFTPIITGAALSQINRFQIRYKWTTPEESVSYVIDRIVIKSANVAFSLPQGDHKIILEVSIPYKETTFNLKVEKTITVKDYLIVAIGDSFSSGEGNPEIPKYNGGKVVWGDNVSSDPSGNNRALQIIQDHQSARRSTLCWSAQAALEIERSDPKTSVTYVNAAISGATLAEIAGYNSLNIDKNQILQLFQIIPGRKIDALTISIGGNDLFFADAIKSLVANDVDLLGALNYKPVSSQEQIIFDNNVKDALKRLPARFDTLASVFSKIAEKVYILEYPNLGCIDKDNNEPRFCEVALDQSAGTSFFKKIFIKGEKIDQEEFKYSYNNILQPLNQKIRDAAKKHEKHGWICIDDVEYCGHGICNGNRFNPSDYQGSKESPPVSLNTILGKGRWVRRYKESNKIQGNEKGTMHPNHYGHRAIAEGFLRKWSAFHRK